MDEQIKEIRLNINEIQAAIEAETKAARAAAAQLDDIESIRRWRICRKFHQMAIRAKAELHRLLAHNVWLNTERAG